MLDIILFRYSDGVQVLSTIEENAKFVVIVA